MLYIKHINFVYKSLCSDFLFLSLFILLCGTATCSPVLEDIQVTRGVNEDSPAWGVDGKKLVYASDQVLTERPAAVIGAVIMVVLVFVIFMIRRFLKKVGFFDSI